MKLKWSLEQLYFYLVCFVMLITLIVGITGLVRATIDLLIPVPDHNVARPYLPNEQQGEESSQLSAEIIEREITEHAAFEDMRTERNTLNSTMRQLFLGLAQLAVALPVYLYHWRRIPASPNNQERR